MLHAHYSNHDCCWHLQSQELIFVSINSSLNRCLDQRETRYTREDAAILAPIWDREVLLSFIYQLLAFMDHSSINESESISSSLNGHDRMYCYGNKNKICYYYWVFDDASMKIIRAVSVRPSVRKSHLFNFKYDLINQVKCTR